MTSVAIPTDTDDLTRDLLLDELAGIQPECMADLLDIAATMIRPVVSSVAPSNPPLLSGLSPRSRTFKSRVAK